MPTVNLTAKTVASISISDQRIEYRDTNLPNFWLRVSPHGRKTFGVSYRHRGRLRRYTIGPTTKISLSKAREEARRVLSEATLGHDPASEDYDAKGLTFRRLAERYVEEYAKKNKRTWMEDRRALDRDLLPRFGNRLAADISRREWIALFERIAERAPVLANRTLEIVRRIYNWGIGRDLLEANPCARITKPGREQQRDRVLNNEELKALWQALEHEPLQIQARYKLQLLTAQRPGEVRHMRWHDINFDEAWWTIPAEMSKNNLSHRVPLSEPALAILRQLKEEAASSVWVFPSPTADGAVRSNTKATNRLKRQSGVDFRPHDLRRTVASMMAGELGVPRLTLSKLLNHVERGVTAVYDRHSYDREKREAVDRWACFLSNLVMTTI